MSYSAEVLADSPAAYWRLEETSGTTLSDSSGNGHDLTATSPTFGETGIVGNAIDFESGNATGVSTADLGITGANSEWTVELWVKGWNNFAPWFAFGGGSGTYRVRDDNTNVEVEIAGFGILETPEVWGNADWTHVVFGFEHDAGASELTLRLFVNGSEEASLTNADGFTTADLDVWLTGESPSNKGSLDEVAVYAAAPDATRIAARYAAATGAAGATYTLAIDAASVSVTAGALGLTASRSLPVGTASVTATAGDVSATASRTLAVDAAAVSVSASPLGLTYTPASGADYTLAVDPASLAVAAGAVGLTVSRTLAVDGPAVTATAAPLGLTAGRSLVLDAAAVSAAAGALAFSLARRLPVATAAVGVAAGALSFDYSGEVTPEVITPSLGAAPGIAPSLGSGSGALTITPSLG